MGGDENNATWHTESQAKSTTACAPSANSRESPQMSRDENLGTRLDQVLSSHGINRAKLAKIAGVGASTVQNWFHQLQRGEITESVWHKLARALQAANIDPSEVRPGAEVPTKSNAAMLIPRVMDIDDREFLTLSLELLTVAGQADRDAIVAVIRSKLRKF